MLVQAGAAHAVSCDNVTEKHIASLYGVRPLGSRAYPSSLSTVTGNERTRLPVA
jgi:hypothetical protein